MFCKKCGSEIPVNASFCPKCGTPVSQNVNRNIYQNPAGSQNFNWAGGVPYPGGTDYQSSGIPMQWYGFVTRLGLFGAAIVYLVFAVRTMLGSAYLAQTISYIKKVAGAFGDLGSLLGDLASELAGLREEYSVKEIWEESGALQAVDIFMIIAWFAMIVFAILVRQQLVQYKRNAPRNLLVLIAGSGVLYFLHSLLRQLIFGGLLKEEMGYTAGINFMVLPVIGLIGAAVAAYLNYMYFSKRAALFRN